MTTAEIKEMATEYVMNTYGERDLAFVRGEGPYLCMFPICITLNRRQN